MPSKTSDDDEAGVGGEGSGEGAAAETEIDPSQSTEEADDAEGGKKEEAQPEKSQDEEEDGKDEAAKEGKEDGPEESKKRERADDESATDASPKKAREEKEEKSSGAGAGDEKSPDDSEMEGEGGKASTTEKKGDPVTDPGPNDFIFARRSMADYHPGNKALLRILEARRPAFASANLAGKRFAVAAIVEDWRKGRSPPGRFLKQDDDQKFWYDVGDEKAGRKVRQMLKDMTSRVVELKKERRARQRESVDGTEGVPIVLDDGPESDRGERKEGGKNFSESYDEAMYQSLTNLHQNFQRSNNMTPEDLEHMSNIMKLQMNMINRQREVIAKKDRGIVELNNLHQEMMTEKDERIQRLKNTIGNFMNGKAMGDYTQNQAAAQLQNAHMMSMQMQMIERQRQTIEQKDRETMEMGRLLATTTQEKDREIWRLRTEITKAKAEGEGAESKSEDKDKDESEEKDKDKGESEEKDKDESEDKDKEKDEDKDKAESEDEGVNV